MVALDVIWMVAAALVSIAVLLWITLMFGHLWSVQRETRNQQIADAWLDRLLLVMDGAEDPSVLPRLRSKQEMEVVVGLLRDLAERFRGTYRERMVLVLQQIGALEFGKKLLESWGADHRIRGAALLSWCGPDEAADLALDDALDDRDGRVTLEAAASLVKRGAVKNIERVLDALCRTRAAHSLLARDLFRRWAADEPSNWSHLLQRDWPETAWILLLEAAGASGQAKWTFWVAQQAKHPSPTVARTALAAVAELGDPDGTAASMAACSSYFADVRLHAAKALGSCGTLGTCREVLELLLDDENYEVRQAAVANLLRLGGGPGLRERLPTDDWQRELFKEAGIISPAAA